MSSSPGARLVAALLAFAALPSLAAQPAHAPVPMKAPTAAEIAAKWPKPVTRYDNAPLAWRDFLQQARAADASKDPLQRCLAFPDFPDNQWPAQAAAQYCDWNFGPRPTLADIRKLLDAGDVQGLDKRYAELQALHQGHADFSERIHSAIDIFDSSYESGALSKRWLELAPDSPYAMAARGNFYMRLGWSARGGKWMRDTPKEQVEQMEAHFAKAIEMFKGALAKEPRLMPAHSGLINIGTNGGLDEDALFAAAVKADPGCTDLMEERMRALEPRWGGSYQAMDALDRQLLPMLAARPLLSLARHDPYYDRQDIFYRAEQYDNALTAILPALPLTPHAAVYERAAAAMLRKKDATDEDRWRELAYLVAASRFRPGEHWVALERGRLFLLLANDPEGAVASLAHAIELEPEDAYAHYLTGASFGRLGRFDDAEREYLLGRKDPDDEAIRRDSLIELTELLARAGLRERARQYAIQAAREYPADPRALYAYAYSFTYLRAPSNDLRAAMEKFIAAAEASKDPRWDKALAEMRKNLAELKASVIKAGGTW